MLPLPHDPDAVCRDLHAALRAATGVEVFAVVLTDTAGRPWREGQVDFALGSHVGCGCLMICAGRSTPTGARSR